MDGSGLNGVSLPHGVDDEDEEEASHRSLEDRSPGTAAGGDAAGKGPGYGRNVNKAAPQDGTPDAASTGQCLPCRPEDSCEISGDHVGLNGFVSPDDWVGVGWTDGEGGGGHAVSGLAVMGEESGMCPAGRLSETSPWGLRRGCGGTTCGEVPDSDDDVMPGARTEDGVVSGRLRVDGPCPVGVPDIHTTTPNGGPLSLPRHGDREADTTRSSRPCGGEEGKLANGGFHVICTPCDPHEPGPSDNNTARDTERGHAPRVTGMMTSQGDYGERDDPGDLGVRPPLPSATQYSTMPGPGPLLHTPSPVTPSSDATDMRPPSPGTGLPSTGTGPPSPGTGLPSPLVARPQSLRTWGSGAAVSLSCDATPLSPEDGGGFYLEVGRRQSAPDPHLPEPPEPCDYSATTAPTRRLTIAEFFTRSLFSRKTKEPVVPTQNATGWRLFGKAAPESDAGPQCPLPPGRRKQLEFEPQSTTALILEDRPGNLPAKCEEEAQRHKQEYQEMVAGARRKEMKEAQRKKRQLKERHRQEESISHAINTWTAHILPHWDHMKCTRRVRELWWQGLPPSIRGRVWSLAIGNDLNITPELYDIFLCRVKDRWRCSSETSSVNDSESDGGASLADRESSLDLIKLDISRTFPSLFIFQKGGPYHDVLHSLLGAYTCYRPDIGYVQGMSFIAAVLILNLDEAEAFITFANLLNKPCQLAFFRVDHDLMLKYFAAFEVFFEENLPRLFRHFLANNLTPDLYLIDWIFTLYSKALPLDVACRVWDVFCRDGEESLFRTALGVLRLYQDVLLQMDFIHMAQFLTRLPPDLPPHLLFSSMANTHMGSRAGRWAQVFSSLTKDGIKETDKNGSPALRS